MYSLTLQNAAGDSVITSGDVLGRINFAVPAESDGFSATYVSSFINCSAEGVFTSGSNPAGLVFGVSSADPNAATGVLKISSDGHFMPLASGTYDLGSSSYPFRNLYIDNGYIVAASGYFDVISFNVDNESILTKGQIGWDDTEGTMDIGLTDNTTIHIGEHRYFRIRNQTGDTLYKGQVVYATGVHSNGLISPAKYVADGTVREVRFMGLVLEDVNDQNNGYVIDFGHLENMDLDGSATNYAVGDETWNDGDILYVHPTVAGKLTKNEPKHSISVAIILDVGNGDGNGRMFVRPTSYGHLDDNHDVAVSGATNGQFLQYNSATDYWVPSSSGNFTTLEVNGTPVPTGVGTTNYVTKWTGANSIGSGIIYDDGTNVGIGTSSPNVKLDVVGSGAFTGNVSVGGKITHPSLTGVNDFIIYSQGDETLISAKAGHVVRIRAGGNDASYETMVSSSYMYIGGNRIRLNSAETTINEFGFNVDFRVEGDADANLLFVDASTDRVGIGTSSPSAKLNVENGNVIFNDLGGNFDFRVEGDTLDYLLHTDASKDEVVIHNAIGYGLNYATSEGWVHATGTPTTSQVGYYGGNFAANGAAENYVDYSDLPNGLRGLVWQSRDNGTDSTNDGGWDKEISGLDPNKTYVSIVYFRRVGSSTTGTFYHGCKGTNTLNLNGTTNGNPYFHSWGMANFPQDVWCVSIGIIHANNDTISANTGFGGIYRLDTGEKIYNLSTDYKMAASATIQTHRTYLYADAVGNTDADWCWPGFYEVTADSIVNLLNTILYDHFSGRDITINEGGGNFDFRVEGDTDQYLLFTDASLDYIGIGTPYPLAKLNVQGPKDVNYGTVNIQDSTSMATNVGGDIIFGGKYTTAGSYARYGRIGGIKENSTDGNSQSAMIFHTNAGSSLAERMRINSSGNVGIGTASPTQKLDVRYPSGGGVAVIKSTDSNYGVLLGDIYPANTAYQGLSHVDFSSTSSYMIMSEGTNTLISADTGGSVYLRGGPNNSSNEIRIYPAASDGIVINEQGADSNFRIEGDTDPLTFFVDAGANSIGIGTSSPSAKLNVENGNVIFNDLGGNFDFRVEGDTDANLLFTDASTDKVGIGTIQPSQKLDVNGRVKANLFVTQDPRSATNLPVGWYTIAVNVGNRAIGRFGLTCESSSRHQGIIFYASHYYGVGNQISILHNNRYSGSNPIAKLRIKEGGVYDGCLLQVYIDDANNTPTVYLLNDNISTAGWNLVSLTADGTNPGGVSNFANLNNVAVEVDLDSTDFGTTGQSIFQGNVGIGTASPQAKLDVNGSIRANNIVTLGSGSIPLPRKPIELLNPTNIAELTINDAYTFPTSDGSADQVLVTDGSGNITWQDQSGGSTSLASIVVTSGQSVFNMVDTYASGSLAVFLNGVKLVAGDDFTETSSTSFTLTSPATSGDIVDYVAYGATIASTNLQKTGDTMTGNLALGSNSIVFDSSVIDNNSLDINICNGRLTLENGVPLSTTDQTAKTTLYFAPYNSNRICLYDTALNKWKMHSFSQLSLSLSGLIANTNYDVFIYNNSGTLILEATAWTDNTTRATALTTQDNIYVKTGAINRRYLGTIRTTNTAGQCEDSTSRRFVWNYYNQVNKTLLATKVLSHTYTIGTIRPWGNITTVGETRYEFVIGSKCLIQNFHNNWSKILYVSLALDSTTTAPFAVTYNQVNAIISHLGTYAAYPSDGYHFIQAVEFSDNANGGGYSISMDGLIPC